MKRLILLICTVVLTTCVFTSCGKEDVASDRENINVYCLNESGELVCEEHTLNRYDSAQAKVENVIQALESEPSNYKYKKLIEDDAKIIKFNLIEGKLMLYFDVGYHNYTGVDEVVRRSGIVKTLTQISGVDGVEFYVDNQLLALSGEKPIGIMTNESIIENASGEASYMQKTTVSVYFSNAQGDKLIEVPIKITYDATIPLEQLMVEQLIQGPDKIEGINQKGVKGTIPEGTQLNSITVKDNVCYVDFNEKFLTKVNGVKSQVTLYSVVNLLVELPTVNKVQFTINGEVESLYGDSIPFDVQFERNLDLVEVKED